MTTTPSWKLEYKYKTASFITSISFPMALAGLTYDHLRPVASPEKFYTPSTRRMETLEKQIGHVGRGMSSDEIRLMELQNLPILLKEYSVLISDPKIKQERIVYEQKRKEWVDRVSILLPTYFFLLISIGTGITTASNYCKYKKSIKEQNPSSP